MYPDLWVRFGSQNFLECLVSNVASFMASVFDMAKAAVENIINTISGWIRSAVDSAIRTIQQLWNGVTSLVSNVRNFLGRRLDEEDSPPMSAEDLPALRAAIEEDHTMSHLDRLTLLDMVSKVEVAQAEADELLGPRRRRMQEEMDEHREELREDLERHHEEHGRGLQSTQTASATQCSSTYQPLQVASASMAVSLPFDADVEISPRVFGSFKASKDLLEEWGVKPKTLPIRFMKTFAIPVFPIIKYAPRDKAVPDLPYQMCAP